MIWPVNPGSSGENIEEHNLPQKPASILASGFLTSFPRSRVGPHEKPCHSELSEESYTFYNRNHASRLTCQWHSPKPGILSCESIKKDIH